MGIFPRMVQRSKILLPIRTNLAEYTEIPELTTISTTTSIPSVQDGPTVVARYRNLTIGAGATLTTQNRCCGLVLVVDGDLTVNGTISMTARGANFAPANDHRIKNDLLPGNDILYEIDIPATADEIAAFLLKEKKRYHSLDELPAIYRPTLYCRGPYGAVYAPADLGSIPAIGGAGAAGRTTSSEGPGNAGSNGSARRCGGGGSGACLGNGNSGAGAAGTCYSGGAASGAAYNATSLPAALYGGAGSAAVANAYSLGGGAGNPGGNGYGSGGAGVSGTGGLLIIICTGEITIEGNGQIIAKGSAGGNASAPGAAGGGSGGGSINIFYGKDLMNGGSISASGGAGGSGGNAGGKGGDGCITLDHYNF